MDILTFIQGYLTVSTISKLIDRKQKRRSVVFDTIFSRRTQTGLPVVRMDEYIDTIRSVPVVTRGGASLTIGGGTNSIAMIEPMPIRLNRLLTGARLNDMRTLFGDGGARGQALVQAEVDRMILKLMETTDKTRDALCAQAITGKIDYQMQAESGFVRYGVTYGSGTPLSYTVTKKWDASGTGIGDILNDAISVRRKLNEEGASGEVGFLVSAEVFVSLANKIVTLPDSKRMGATVAANEINVAGFVFTLCDGSYDDRNSSGEAVVKQEVEAKKAVAWVKDIPELTYCAVDDLDGNLEAIPFFSKSVKVEDPSGIRIISESKPFPMVSEKAFCWFEPLGD
jgi:hypothetical protein